MPPRGAGSAVFSVVAPAAAGLLLSAKDRARFWRLGAAMELLENVCGGGAATLTDLAARLGEGRAAGGGEVAGGRPTAPSRGRGGRRPPPGDAPLETIPALLAPPATSAAAEALTKRLQHATRTVHNMLHKTCVFHHRPSANRLLLRANAASNVFEGAAGRMGASGC